jgi:hypothetical protein
MPRIRACRFSSVVSAGSPANSLEHAGEGLHRRFDGDLVVAHAEQANHLARIG